MFKYLFSGYSNYIRPTNYMPFFPKSKMITQ